MTEKQILIDIWEGDTNLDHDTLIKNGVKGMVVRINDINGGHHLDTQFLINYQVSKKYLINSIYFVYNPWVKGKPNLDWLSANIPLDFKGRIFVDIEVKYQNYSPVDYANEIAYFISELSKKYLVTPYTGGGYLQLLSYWPKCDYWWANYFYSLYPNSVTKITWEDFYKIIVQYPEMPQSVINSSPNKNVKLWQCTGDRLILPGMATHAVDLNIFYGTEDELIAYFGGKNSGSIVNPISDPIVNPTTESTMKFKTNFTLNVRKSPIVADNKVGTIPAGTIVNISDFEGRDVWGEIADGQFKGNFIAVDVNDTKYLNKES